MAYLILGLILFLGTHSIRIFAESWREKQISKWGEQAWQGVYSLISIVGFILLIWGFSQAWSETDLLWNPPIWTKYLAALFTLISFIFFAAAYVPGTKIKAKLGHPMILGVKLWAFAHLISNGSVADIVLFGSFLIWAILDFRASRRREKIAKDIPIFIGYKRDIMVIIIGGIAWGIFAFYLHGLLIGVKPLT